MTLKKESKKVTLKIKEEIASEFINKLPPVEEKKEEKKGPGRPGKITSNVLQKLKVCFSVGMTDQQACYFCGIGVSTLYDYFKTNPEFSEEKEILKTSISLQAKFNIGRAIKIEENKSYGGTGNSWKWLGIKDPEFRDKLRIDGTIRTEMNDEDKIMYDQILKNNKMLGLGN